MGFNIYSVFLVYQLCLALASESVTGTVMVMVELMIKWEITDTENHTVRVSYLTPGNYRINRSM